MRRGYRLSMPAETTSRPEADPAATGPPPWIYPAAIAGLLLPPVLGFALGGVWLGLLLGGLAAGALLFVAARQTPRDPIAEGPPEAGTPTLALAVTPIEDRATAERVAQIARESTTGAPRVLALAPVEPTAAERWLSLRGSVWPDADARLKRTLETLRAVGCEAEGEVVDEDPERAVADQAAVHGAAAITFVVPVGWDGEDKVDAVRSRTTRPVHVVEVA